MQQPAILRSTWQIVIDASKNSPYDFAYALMFAVGSILYVVSAVMSLLGTYTSGGGVIIDIFAPLCDLLSAILVTAAWRNNWLLEHN